MQVIDGSVKVRGRHYATGRLCDFSLRDGRIESVLPITAEAAADDDELWVAPGLIDLQINGYGGHDFLSADVTPDDVLAVAKALPRLGVTAFCPTVTTNAFEMMATSLAAIDLACRSDNIAAERILGVHLEGPYISPEDGPRGAHPHEHVRPANWDEFCRLQTAAGGRIRLVTLAPEVVGAMDFVRCATHAGVRVAIGHHAASPEQIDAAVTAGAVLATHLGNGTHAQIHRHHNGLWTQLANDDLMASIIADGHHLPLPVLKVFYRAKGPSRLILVSDLLAVAGLPPGPYRSMGLDIELCSNGFVRLLGTPYLAGSSTGLAEALRFLVASAGVPFHDAVTMASRNPAQFMGEWPERGKLQVGARADLALFREDAGGFRLAGTIAGGCQLYTEDGRHTRGRPAILEMHSEA